MGQRRFFVRKAAGVAACVLLATACTGLQKDPDPTPINPTAVLEIQTASTGLLDIAAFENTTLAYTRPGMQRTESRNGGTVARLVDGETMVRIERLDRKLVWTLDAKNKQAVECPLRGCSRAGTKSAAPRNAGNDEKGAEPACRLRVATTAISVEPTGQKRKLDGFDTEQYDVRWIVTFRDNAQRKSTSTVSIDTWVAAATPEWNNAATIEKTWDRARDKALGGDTDSERQGLLPAEVARMMSGYLATNVSPTDRANFLAGAKKLDKVKGVPILTIVKWSFSGEACSTDGTTKHTGDANLFTFTSEIKSHRVEARHDSLFAPPGDYKIKR
ncbi:MAG: hypothetical protein ABI771_03535 [Betaproteobacteria bacterium]